MYARGSRRPEAAPGRGDFRDGGPQMHAAGVEIITDYSEVSVVGITEVLKRLPSLVRAMRRLVDEAERRRRRLRF